MYKALAETIEQYGKPLRGGEIIDAYNRTVITDGISVAISTCINHDQRAYLVVNAKCYGVIENEEL